MPYKFPKHEKLTRRKDFEILRNEGKKIPSETVYAYYYLAFSQEKNDYLKVAFIIGKRKFKKANKRNLLRRRLREAFRLHKNTLVQKLQEKNLSLKLLFVYGKKEIQDFSVLEKEVKKILFVLEELIKKHNGN